MSKNNFVEEEEVEVEVATKKEKKKKTSEERGKDRKVVFWVLLLVVAMTVAFWLKAAVSGNGFKTLDEQNENYREKDELPNEGEMDSNNGFFVKYDI